MTNLNITLNIILQLQALGLDLKGNDNDILIAYNDLLIEINNQSPIRSFQLPIPKASGLSIMIIEFEDLPLIPDLRLGIQYEIEKFNDEAVQVKYLNFNTMVINLNH